MPADLRNALRQLRKSPGFAVVAVLTLALGIGISTTTFTWVRATLFAALPVDDPERIALIWSSSPARGADRSPSSAADFSDWHATSASFEELAAAVPANYNLADGDAGARATALRVTSSFFRVFRSAPAAGRLLVSEDDSPGVRVAVLSHRFWTTRFGSDRGIVGRAITLDGQSYVVVGVANEAASLLPVDLWSPLPLGAEPTARDRRELFVIGRMTSNTTIDQARAELSAIAARLAQTYPNTNSGWGVQIVSLRDTVLGPDTNAFLMVFTGAVLFVLLIGCANIANLLLARGLGRTQEVAIRMALGAGRQRLIRQFLTESVVLGAFGGAAGLLVAVWLNDLLRGTVLGATPFANSVRIDASVVLFTSAISVVAALIFGLAPAVQSSALELQSALKVGPGAGGQTSRSRLRQTIVAGEIALATALLVVAGVLIQTGIAVRTANPGFDASNLLTARIVLPQAAYASDERVTVFYTQAIAALAGRPGVIDAAATTRLPLAGGANPNRTVEIEGQPVTGGSQAWAVDLVVSPAYFRALRIPIIAGRAFTDRDVAGSQLVAIVSETFASRYLREGPFDSLTLAQERQSVGARIGLGASGAWLQVVGVAADVRNDDLGEPPVPQVYLPHAQHPAREMSLIVRSATEPIAIHGQVESVVHGLDPTLAVAQVRTMEQVVEADMPDVPVIIGILTVCSTLALLLATLGIYGVVAYSVRQQMREFAIRLALGASRGDVVSLAIGRAARWAAGGLITGVAAAFAFTRVLAHAVDFVEGVDNAMLAITVATLILTILAASWLPARAAGRVDPATAMRVE